jgi:hypothetical protein
LTTLNLGMEGDATNACEPTGSGSSSGLAAAVWPMTFVPPSLICARGGVELMRTDPSSNRWWTETTVEPVTTLTGLEVTAGQNRRCSLKDDKLPPAHECTAGACFPATRGKV